MVLNRFFSKMSPELRLVLNCTKYESPNEEIRALLSSKINWDWVLRLSIVHGLFPLVYNTLKSLDDRLVPEYVLKTLQQNCIKNALKVFGMTDEIVRITKNMVEYGIQPLVLKGSALSVKINEDIALRPSNDIDILVDPHEFAKAEKILEQIGYKRYSPDFLLTPRQQKAYFKRHHHFEYFNIDRTIHVDLHWRIRSFEVKSFPTTSNLATQKINMTGCLVPVMADEYWLMFLMVHGYKHMWSRLRWLYDIKEFIKMNIDWDKVIVQADISELRPIMHQTLILVNEFFDVPIPDRLKAAIGNDKKAWQLAYTSIEKLLDNINVIKPIDHSFSTLIKNILDKFNYYYLDSKWKNRLFYLISFLKPSEIEFKLISLPDILYPFYYLIRPVYWLWRHIVKCLPSKKISF